MTKEEDLHEIVEYFFGDRIKALKKRMKEEGKMLILTEEKEDESKV